MELVPELADERAAERARTIGEELARFEAKQAKRVALGKKPSERTAGAIERRRKHLRELRRVHRYRWSFITITVKWAPWEVEETHPQAYRARAEGLWAAVAHAWESGLNHSGLGVTALFARLEVNDEGFLHAHLLFRGGVVNKTWLEGVLAEAYPAAGFVKIKPVVAGGERDAIAEVAKYVVKMRGVLSNAWVANERRPVLHPELAAAVEIGLDGIDSHRSYGVLRSISDADELDDQAEEVESTDLVDLADEEEAEAEGERVPDDDHQVACRRCGAVGAWETRCVRTMDFARVCRRARLSMTARPRDG